MTNVLPVINSLLTRHDNNVWNFRLGQISHTIFWGAEELGEGCVIITLIVSCLEWLICLLLFIMVEFEKVAYRTDITQITLSHEMLSHTLVSNMPDGLSVQPPPPPGKLAAQLKLTIFVYHIFITCGIYPRCMLMFKVGKGTSPGVLNSLKKKFQF